MQISQCHFFFFLLTALPVSFSQRVLKPAPGNILEGSDKFFNDLNELFPTITCHTYSMSHSDENYETPQIDEEGLNWGMHALQWKGYNHIEDNPWLGTFDADLASTSNPPALWSGLNGPTPTYRHVSCYGEEELDILEQASSGIFNTDGHPTDPTGTWNCVEESDPFSAAVLGAMNMFHWNTPTYVDSKYRSPDCPGPGCCFDGDCFSVVVMKKVTLCAEGSEPPHIACNWIENSEEVGSCESTLVLESISAGIFGGGYWEDDTVFGPDNIQNWETYYLAAQNANGPANESYDTNHLVFDPPAGTDIAALQAGAHLTASSVLHPSELARMIESNRDSTTANQEGSMRGGASRGGKK